MSNDGEFVLENYFLKPGYVYIPREPAVISAAMGPAVRVCIYDRKRHAAACAISNTLL